MSSPQSLLTHNQHLLRREMKGGKGDLLIDSVKKPPGDTVGAGGAADPDPATVTPVTTARDAAMDERPGVIAPVVVKAAAAPTAAPAPPDSQAEDAGGVSVPHQHPGGAFIH